ncbi:MAG: molybdopterin-guanine dinucleotide biosynthesis protein B [Dehalococcoidia bacterium]|nr:molybdopterin-guanine dinucleotide biosynthesis protein B [Dehalococcoidia bacterium]
MVPVICVIGRSNSGKTLLMKQLIADLKERRYRVAAIKHSRHISDSDIPGKDTWNYSQAGSDLVGLSSPGHVSLTMKADSDPHLAEIVRLIGPDFDVILAEGFKLSSMPKIHVFRDGIDDELLCSEEDLIAVVADKQMPFQVPLFSPRDISGLVGLIEIRILEAKEPEMVMLYANGKSIPTTGFVRHMFAQTLRGMLSSLKDVPPDLRSIDLSIRFSDPDAHPSDAEER